MRSVIRKPSIKKSVAARTTGRVTRTVRKLSSPAYNKKGVGYIKNPKRAMYNKFYNKTSYGIQDIFTFRHSHSAACSSSAEPITQSDTYVITNHNISDFVQEHPKTVEIIHRQFIMRFIFGILLLSIACLCIFTDKSQFLFTIGLILLGVAIYQLHKSNQYRNAYTDAKECMRKIHSDKTQELFNRLRS